VSPEDFRFDGPRSPSRRRFVQGLAAGGVVAGCGLLPRYALASPVRMGSNVLSGTHFDLSIGQTPVNFTGRTRPAITVNGSLPAPTLRWREGDTVSIRVANTLPAGSIHGHEASIHWHGIQLPANMDGVPGLSFNGIHRGESYLYRFQVRQAGTYWYHSHSGFQEQAGLFGALVIDPLEPEPFAYDRDYVVLLSDWTDLEPAALFTRLKQMSDYDNLHKRTVGDFVHDAQKDGLAATLADRRMWGRMRMTPTDLSDVDAHTYTYLMNGTTSLGNWTGLFRPGEKVRLRFINGSAMTYFDVRIPGLKMTVVAADGQYVHPVTVDEFRIATAEVFDVIVEPADQDAFTIFAQDMGRTGYVAGTLAVREGLRAPVPTLDPRPILSIADMGMAGMSGMGSMPGIQAGNTGGHDMPSMPGMDMSATSGLTPAIEPTAVPATSMSEMRMGPPGGNPLVDMKTMAPVPKLDDPGIGLRDNGRAVLTYAMLHSAFADPDGREPGRTIELRLTGHMEKFAWSFDGVKFDDAAPVRLNYGERVRIVLVNDSMMSHPIHLHGMFSDLEDAHGRFQVRKHTIDMPPGSQRSYRVRADALGRWAYHCHLLFHMEAGMMRTVEVRE
jgi:CopA family copper-resistance protein